jgi:hypothetical protein
MLIRILTRLARDQGTAQMLMFCASENGVELGLLDPSSSTTNHEDESDSTPHTSVSGVPDHRRNLHQVIGDALEVFSRHLRAEN